MGKKHRVRLTIQPGVELPDVKTQIKPLKIPLPFERQRSGRSIYVPPQHFSGYGQLFERLLLRKRAYFTEEYGKTEADFIKYLQNKTDFYDQEIQPLHQGEPKFNLKTEIDDYAKLKSTSHGGAKRFRLKKRQREKSLKLSAASVKKQSSIQAGTSVRPFQYRLSDPEMLRLGITQDTQVTNKPVSLFIFSLLLTNPHVSPLMEMEPDEKLLYPDSGRPAALATSETRLLFDRRGQLALTVQSDFFGIYIVVYSSEPRRFRDGLQPAPLAIFDLNGNGVVYDENGKKRLIFDQAEGTLFDSPSGIPMKWKWSTFEQMMSRREELQYVKPDEVPDVESEDKMKMKARRDLTKNKHKLFKKKKASLYNWGGKELPPDGASIIGEGEPAKKSKDPWAPKFDQGLIKFMFGDLKKELEKLDWPALLKFTETGCRIEPLREPCQTVLGLSTDESSLDRVRLPSTSQQAKKSKRRFPRKSGGASRDLLVKCFPTTFSEQVKLLATVSSTLKPIVMRISESVSLVVMSQQHIHVTFSSHPYHFIFSIGGTVDIDNLKSMFSVKVAQESKEPIPCFFEVMHNKSVGLKSLYDKIQQMRTNSAIRAQQSHLNYMKIWGYDFFMEARQEVSTGLRVQTQIK